MSIQSYTEEFRRVAEHFRSVWESLHADIPIAWPNMRFDSNDKEAYVRFSLQSGAEGQASIGAPGANRFRNVGVLFLTLYVKSGVGEIAGRQMADEIADAFRRLVLDSLRFNDPTVTPLGNAEAYYRFSVTVSYTRDAYH